MKVLKNPVFDWATCKLESAEKVIEKSKAKHKK